MVNTFFFQHIAASIDVKFKSRDKFLIRILILIKAEVVSIFTVTQTDGLSVVQLYVNAVNKICIMKTTAGK